MPGDVRHVLVDLGGDGHIEAGVGEGQRGRVALDDGGPAGNGLVGAGALGERDHAVGDVQAGDVAGRPDLFGHLRHQEPGACADIEDPFSGLERELVQCGVPLRAHIGRAVDGFELRGGVGVEQ